MGIPMGRYRALYRPDTSFVSSARSHMGGKAGIATIDRKYAAGAFNPAHKATSKKAVYTNVFLL